MLDVYQSLALTLLLINICLSYGAFVYYRKYKKSEKDLKSEYEYSGSIPWLAKDPNKQDKLLESTQMLKDRLEKVKKVRNANREQNEEKID